MSVVAWDGETLATDSQGTSCEARQRVHKIRQLENGTILAYVGQQDTGLILFEWYQSGADLTHWPTSQAVEKDSSLLIVVTSIREVTTYGQYAVALPLLEPFWAWGSGRDYALGALAAGMDARKAAEIAIKFNTNCGFEIEAFDVTSLSLVKTGD